MIVASPIRIWLITVLYSKKRIALPLSNVFFCLIGLRVLMSIMCGTNEVYNFPSTLSLALPGPVSVSVDGSFVRCFWNCALQRNTKGNGRTESICWGFRITLKRLSCLWAWNPSEELCALLLPSGGSWKRPPRSLFGLWLPDKYFFPLNINQWTGRKMYSLSEIHDELQVTLKASHLSRGRT